MRKNLHVFILALHCCGPLGRFLGLSPISPELVNQDTRVTNVQVTVDRPEGFGGCLYGEV